MMGPGNILGYFPVGPELEVKAKIREAGGNRWSPGRLGLMATGVITSLPGWQAADCGSVLFNVWSGPGISEWRKRNHGDVVGRAQGHTAHEVRAVSQASGLRCWA